MISGLFGNVFGFRGWLWHGHLGLVLSRIDRDPYSEFTYSHSYTIKTNMTRAVRSNRLDCFDVTR